MTSSLTPLWNGFQYKSHQEIGISWMLERESSSESGGLLCDEMGLGKTMEILGTMKNSKKVQTLLLCPKAVISQWRTAAMKSNFTVFEIVGAVWKPTVFRAGAKMLFITNYDRMDKKRMSIFRDRLWDRIVLDEAHRVRNAKSHLFNDINRLSRKTIWAVTATPIVNDLQDMRNLFALVGYDPIMLKNYQYLQRVVSEACIHRSMEEMRSILHELPAAPIITKEALDFETEEEAEFYRGIQGNIMRRWRALESDQTQVMFVLLMRLRQLSLHPQVYINARKKEWLGYQRDDWTASIGSSTKFTQLRKKLEAPDAEPSRWIVFCQFHDEMEILQDYLKASPAVSHVWQYHGGMTDKQKDGVIEDTTTQLTESGQHQVLLLQLQSGGVGLNLQHFSRVIFMSPWWTAALMDQAIGRAVRIGQTKLVEVTMLVLKEESSMNIDEKMLEKVEIKRDILHRIFMHASRGGDSHRGGLATEKEHASRGGDSHRGGLATEKVLVAEEQTMLTLIDEDPQ